MKSPRAFLSAFGVGALLACSAFAADLSTIELLPAAAKPTGNAKTEMVNGQENIGFWNRGSDTVSWQVNLPSAGTWFVSAYIASPESDSEGTIAVTLGTARCVGSLLQTGGWQDYTHMPLGKLVVTKSGPQTLTIGAVDPTAWIAINLRSVLLRRVK